MAVTGSMWQLRGYMAITGARWLLRGLCGNYGIYVAITRSMWQLQGLCGNYMVFVAITGSMWQLRGLCGNYRVYVAITGSMWQLRGLHVADTGSYVALPGRLSCAPHNNHLVPVIAMKPCNYHDIAMSHSILKKKKEEKYLYGSYGASLHGGISVLIGTTCSNVCSFENLCDVLEHKFNPFPACCLVHCERP